MWPNMYFCTTFGYRIGGLISEISRIFIVIFVDSGTEYFNLIYWGDIG